MPAKRRSIVLNLILSGETAWGTSGRLHGRTDLPLSAAGRAAVSADAERFARLRLGTIYHAPDEAASDTAAVLAQACGARARGVSELADPNLGLLEGLTGRQFAERFPTRFKQWESDPLSLSPPEGEAIAGARSRIFAAIAKQMRRSRGREVGVVLHRLGVGFVRCWAARRPTTDLWTLVAEGPAVERYVVPMVFVPRLQSADLVEEQ